MLFIVLYVIILNIIYNISGFFFVVSFLIWSINFIVATIWLIGHPNNYVIRFVQLISLIVTLYIVFLNIKFLLFTIFI